MRPLSFAHPRFDDHSLLDSGEGEKLERFGAVLLRRPDPQAFWRRRLGGSDSPWERADLVFVRESDRGGRWEARRGAPACALGADAEWPVRFGEGRFLVRPTPFKHVGLFPEQAVNWEWTRARAADLPDGRRLLNLFGYTGVASVLAAQAGYEVTHVDASRTSLAWLRENARESGLAEDAIRVVLDDALAFARREARRGARYEGILVDPPHYGRGPKGERWRFEQGIAPLLAACASLLAERSFLILSAYAFGTSPIALGNLVSGLEGGRVEVGELVLPEERRSEEGGVEPRLLPSGFCARWTRGLD